MQRTSTLLLVKRHPPLSPNGFSLIEVLIVIGMLSALSVGVVNLSSQYSKISKKSVYDQSTTQLVYVIESTLRDSRACYNTLVITSDRNGVVSSSESYKTTPLGSGTPIYGILDKKGNIKFRAGCSESNYTPCSFDGGKIFIRSMNIKEYEDGTYLSLTLDRAIRNNGGQFKRLKGSYKIQKKIPINLTLTDKGLIKDCLTDRDHYLSSSCNQLQGKITDGNTVKCKSIKIESEEGSKAAITTIGNIEINPADKVGNLTISNGNLEINKGAIIINKDASSSKHFNISGDSANLLLSDNTEDILNLKIGKLGGIIRGEEGKIGINSDLKSSLKESFNVNGNLLIEDGSFKITTDNTTLELLHDKSSNSFMFKGNNLSIDSISSTNWNGIDSSNKKYIATQGWVTSFIYSKLLKGNADEQIIGNLLSYSEKNELSLLKASICNSIKNFSWKNSQCIPEIICGESEYLRGFDSNGAPLCVKLEASVEVTIKTKLDTALSQFGQNQEICKNLKKNASYLHPQKCAWDEYKTYRSVWTECLDSHSCQPGYSQNYCHWSGDVKAGANCPNTCGWAWQYHYRCEQNQARTCKCSIEDGACKGTSCSSWLAN